MKKLIILYSLLFLYLCINIFIIVPSKPSLFNEIINPLMWFTICGIALFLTKDSDQRVKDKSNKTQSLIIAMIIYIIVYFLLGLVFGYQKSPYSKEILNILKNVWSFGSIVIFQEIVRNSIIKLERKKKFNFIILTIFFILVNISYGTFLENFSNTKDTFVYIVTILIPLIVTSGVLTYLSNIGGTKLPIIYRLFFILPEFIVPILPNFDWFMLAIVGLTLPVVVFIYLNYIHVNKEQQLSKRDRKRYNPIIYVPVFIIIAVVAGFVIGLFKYQPIAVLSNSMHPTFSRGDAVVVKKLSDTEKKNLKEESIIQFVSGSKYVVHRIVKVDNDKYGNKIFVTKGDYNNGVDVDKVSQDQIIGTVSFVIPYIGWPSVWLSELAS